MNSQPWGPNKDTVPLLSLFVYYVIGGCIWVYVGTIMENKYAKLGIAEKTAREGERREEGWERE